MAFEERLIVRVVGHGKDAIQELNRVGTAANQMGDTVNASGSRSSKIMGKLGISSGMVGAAMKGAAIGAGILAATSIAKWAAGGVDQFVALASKVRDFQRASGASAETSSKFVAVLDDFGISAGAGGKAIFKLGREISTGGGELARFGVVVAKNKGGNTDLTETLLNVADAYAGITDPAERAALVQQAFGKGGKDLIPILERGREGLKSFFESAQGDAQILSQEDLDAAFEYELAIDNLDDAMSGLQRTIGRELTPAFADFTNGLATAVREVPGSLSILGNAISGWGDIAGGLTALLTGSQEGILAPWQQLASGVAGAGLGLDLDFGFMSDAEKATERVKTAFSGVTEATQNWHAALRSGDPALIASSEKALTLANKELTASTKDAGSETDRLERSQAKADATTKAMIVSTGILRAGIVGLGDAQRGVAAAGLDYADAQARQTAAEIALQEARDAGDPAAIAQAERDLYRAALDTTAARERQTEVALVATQAEAAYNMAAKDPAARNEIIAQLRAAQVAHPAMRGEIQVTIDKIIALGVAADNAAKPRKGSVGVFLDSGSVAGVQRTLAEAFPSDLRVKVTPYSTFAGFPGGSGGKSAAPWPGGADGNVWTPYPKALGGPVSKMQPYIVGERGPELFVPATSGHIVPNKSLNGSGGGSSSSNSSSLTVNVSVASGGDPAEVGRKTVDAIKAYERRSGSFWRNN